MIDVTPPKSLRERFPHLRSEIRHLANEDPGFRQLSDDYELLVQSLKETSPDANGNREEIISLKTSLEVEALEKLTPMDYDCMATAPAWTADGTAADGYTKSSVLANQITKFIHGLGYHAVGAGNDLGSSVPYAIMAGLGEGGRNGALLSPGIGPRHRICKIYTDFEFVEYDQPHTWGITEFCLSCGKCADACPSDAIPKLDSENGGYGFEPNYEFSDQPGYTWNNHHGIQKFYSDAKKCYNFRVENGSACAACIASCTFNEPDMWHHVFIMGITPKTPGFLHAWMAQLHPKFGYGSTAGPSKVEKFWTTGEGMRTNTELKNNIGTSNKS